MKIFMTTVLMLLCSIESQAQNYDYLKNLVGSYFGTKQAGNPPVGMEITAIRRDSANNVYVAGIAMNAPTTTGAFKTIASAADGFVAKFDPSLSRLLYCTYIGGYGIAGQHDSTRWDYVDAMEIDSNQCVHLSVVSNDTTFPVTQASDRPYQRSTPRHCYYACLLSSDGSQLLYSRLVASFGNIVDQTASAWRVRSGWGWGGKTLMVTGASSLTLGPDGTSFMVVNVDGAGYVALSANAYRSLSGGGSDITLFRITKSGLIDYGSYFGGAGADYSMSICYSHGSVYFCGQSQQSDLPGPLVGSRSALSDVFVTRWTSTGAMTPQMTHIVGGTEDEEAYCIRVNEAMNMVCICGYVNSRKLPNTSTLLNGLDFGAYIASFTTDLSVRRHLTLFSQFIVPRSLSILSDGSIVCVGQTGVASVAAPITPRALYATQIGNGDLYTLRVDSSTMKILYASFYGGSGAESSSLSSFVRETPPCGYSLYLGFGTTSTNLPVTQGAYQMSPAGYLGLEVLTSSHYDTLIVDSVACASYRFRTPADTTPACGASSIEWNFGDGSAIQTGTPLIHTFAANGIYNVSLRISYPNGEVSTLTRRMTINAYPTVQAFPQTANRCANGAAIALSVKGAFRYEWTPSEGLSDSTKANPMATPTHDITYYVRGYTFAGCSSIDSVRVTVSSVKASLNISDTTICEGSELQLRASGAAYVSWSPSFGLSSTTKAEVTARPTQSIVYRAVVSSTSCSDTAYVRVRVAHKPALKLSPEAIICAGGSTNLLASVTAQDSADTLGLTYLWAPAESLSSTTNAKTLASPDQTTWYTCKVSNAFGCVALDSVRVRVLNSLHLSVPADTVICRGSSARLQASGGALYAWSPATGLDDSSSAAPLCTATSEIRYRVVTWSGDYASATCRDTAFVQLHLTSVPRVSLPNSYVICTGSQLGIKAKVDSNGSRETFSIEWRSEFGEIVGSGDSAWLQPTVPTHYICTLKTEHGCSASDTVFVNLTNKLDIHIESVSAVLPGTSVVLRSLPFYTDGDYQWLDEQHAVLSRADSCTIVVTGPGWYYVHLRRGSCEGLDSVFVDTSAFVHVQARSDMQLCRGSSGILFIINPQPATLYEWSEAGASWSAMGDSVVIVADLDRQYSVRATQGQNKSYDTVNLKVLPLPVFAVHDTTVCEGELVRLYADDYDDSDTFIWRDAGQRILAESRWCEVDPSFSGTIFITAHNSANCESTQSLNVARTSRDKLLLRVQIPDTLLPGQYVDLGYTAALSRFVAAAHLRLALHLPAELLTLPGAVRQGADQVVVLDTVVDLQSTERILASYSVRALVNQVHVGEVWIEVLRSSIDSSCTDILAGRQNVVVRPACGNTLYQIQASGGFLRVSPNPSTGDVLVESSDEFTIYDPLGNLVEANVSIIMQDDNSLKAQIKGLASGIYTIVKHGTQAQTLRIVVVH